jgi:hypothetical protein
VVKRYKPWLSQERKFLNAKCANVRMDANKVGKLAKFASARHSRSKTIGLSSNNEKAIDPAGLAY